MTIDTVTVHHSKHPKAWYRGKLTLDTVTVLIDFAHLGDEASSGLDTNLLNYLWHKRRSTRLTIFVLLRAGLKVLGGGSLPTYIDTREVCSLLQVLVWSRWINLN